MTPKEDNKTAESHFKTIVLIVCVRAPKVQTKISKINRLTLRKFFSSYWSTCILPEIEVYQKH